MNIERVLIVEDRQEEAEQLSRAFRKLIGRPDPDVDPAPWVATLPEALARLAGETFSVVILDLTLKDAGPLDEGVRVLRFLRFLHLFHSSQVATPVVVLTGRNVIEICVRAMRAGAADYLLKGYSEDGRIDEDTIDRLYRACEAAYARAAGLEAKSINDWLDVFDGDLRRRYGGKFVTVFARGTAIEEAAELGGRRLLAFESRNEAATTFLAHPEWLDTDLHLAFIGKEEADAAGV